MQQRTTLNLNRAVLPEDQAFYASSHASASASTSNPVMNVASGSTNSVLSPMSAYFDGPPSFFPGQAASAAPLPGLEEAAEHSTVQRERPVVPQQVCLQAGLPAPTFQVPFGGNLPVSSGVTMTPVSPGLQPMCASIPAGSTGPAAAAGGASSVPSNTGNVGVASSNPTLLQSRPPKKEVAKEETKKTAQGRAPCPIAVYVDLSSLRLREKK